MPQHPFAVDFSVPVTWKGGDTGSSMQYTASITPISASLRLYKVVITAQISGNNDPGPANCYHVTSYPLNNGRDDHWKDAVTWFSDPFIQEIGKAIDRHLHEKRSGSLAM